jgi:hypothetical protein
MPDALELTRKDMSDNLNYRLRRSESCRLESVIGAGLLACPIGCIMAGLLFILVYIEIVLAQPFLISSATLSKGVIQIQSLSRADSYYLFYALRA